VINFVCLAIDVQVEGRDYRCVAAVRAALVRLMRGIPGARNAPRTDRELPGAQWDVTGCGAAESA